ncbi:3-deoxy-D-manno-octulosonic acid kinase [Pseudoxanthomonas putridarboris]|uniref:3-deoxy-D-manno-octulosonic acid kinase n=1 Tax=Pseudoxanthomonas putridarboris TaxID=752605 RepID=A0ABU9J149_9GAMM
MVGFDASESLTPFRDGSGYGAILFDRKHLRQADPDWFLPEKWGDRARPVDSGGRGGAWFIDAPSSQCVLRVYRRGGLAARFSRDRYLWHGPNRTRSFAEFRLTRALLARGLPVPRPVAASYLRDGMFYRAAILMERLLDVRPLADLAQSQGPHAPWESAGRLVARFHRAGLDHADLNAHNILFDDKGHGWLIDFDRGNLRIPATAWREENLARLKRSLLKLRGERGTDEVERHFAVLRKAYDHTWSRGY